MLTALCAWAIFANSTSNELDRLVDTYIAERHVMGLSAVVMKGGVVVDECYRGYADQVAGVKVDRTTRMRLASISKSVTATLAMRAVEKGLIDLDADVRKYVPEWPDKGETITLREVLSHRSGIRHYQTGKKDAGYEELTTSQALDLFKNDPLLFKPNEKYSYSTHGFTLVAAALENVTHKKMPQLVKELSLETSGPTLQCESLAGKWPTWRSKHYVVKDSAAVPAGRAENLSWKYGGGGMESSAVDLAKFGYAVEKAKVLKLATRDTLWADPEKDGYALGWVVNGAIREHSGSQQGAQSFLMVDPMKDIVIVVLTNTVPNPPATLAKQIYALVSKE
ncbi:MAG: serine hydrolase domain-containing protein [Fimbriimonadaceae bacterium]